MFCTEVGIPNANIDKKERLITDEVNANNVETSSRCEMWLEEIRKGLTKANEKYNAKAYDEIKVRVFKGEKDTIKAHAESRGESLNGFIKRAIDETIERDTK